MNVFLLSDFSLQRADATSSFHRRPLQIQRAEQNVFDFNEKEEKHSGHMIQDYLEK